MKPEKEKEANANGNEKGDTECISKANTNKEKSFGGKKEKKTEIQFVKEDDVTVHVKN